MQASLNGIFLLGTLSYLILRLRLRLRFSFTIWIFSLSVYYYICILLVLYRYTSSLQVQVLVLISTRHECKTTIYLSNCYSLLSTMYTLHHKDTTKNQFFTCNPTGYCQMGAGLHFVSILLVAEGETNIGRCDHVVPRLIPNDLVLTVVLDTCMCFVGPRYGTLLNSHRDEITIRGL
jgi:hypothetical protein